VLLIVRTFAGPFTAEQTRAFVHALESLCATPLDHPSIARPVACGVERDRPYLVHACLPGVPADEFLRARGPLPLADLLLPITQAAAALDFADAAGVHHGVLSLPDLIIGAESSGISGLGLVQALRDGGVAIDAPTHADDIRALAAIAVHLLIGRPVAIEQLRPSLGFVEGINAGLLSDVIAAAMSDDPARRPASALEFAAALQRAVGEAPVTRAAARPAVGAIALDFDRMRAVESTPIADVQYRDRESSGHGAATPALFAQAVTPSSSHRGRWAVAAMVTTAVLVAAGLSMRGGFRLDVWNRIAPPAQAPKAAATGAATGAAGQPAAPPAAAATGQVFSETTVTPPESRPQAATPNAPPAPAVPVPDPSEQLARPERPVVVPTTGGLLVHSVPSGASVAIDGQLRGQTPAAIRALEFGRHSIEVTAAGYAPWRDEVALTADRPARSLDVTLESGGRAVPTSGSRSGALQIDSRPQGALVFVDGAEVGRTPLSMPGVESGPHSIRIEAAGYRPWTTSVAVLSGERARVAASLEQ
jgi:hypothetical protein